MPGHKPHNVVMLSSELEERITRAGARLRIGFPRLLRPFLFRGLEGIALGRSIYLCPEAVEWSSERRESLIRHELVHVDQAHRLGLPRFLIGYVREYLHLRLRGLGTVEAYWNHPFEVEARSREKEV